MKSIIINLINKFGYLGIFFLIAIENIFPPIPSELILTFSGYITNYSNLNIFIVIIISTLGSIFGSLILYLIGYKVKNFNYFNKKDFIYTSNYFYNNKKSIFFGRFIPIIRSLISLPAGISKMNIIKFLIYTTIGSLIWNSILIILGNIVGNNWYKIVNIFNIYSYIILSIIFFIIIYFIKKKNK